MISNPHQANEILLSLWFDQLFVSLFKND